MRLSKSKWLVVPAATLAVAAAWLWYRLGDDAVVDAAAPYDDVDLNEPALSI